MTEEMNKNDVPQRRSGNKRRRKRKRKVQEHKRPVGKHAKLKGILRKVLYACVALALIGCIYAVAVIISAPSIDPGNLYSYLNESSILYDDDGKKVKSVYAGDEGNRENVDYDQIPEDMVNAIVAIEDKTFWKHHGFNVIRIFGAIKDSVFGGGQISGTSTITQQLARNIYLTNERSLTRKIREAYYTICLERKLTKEQIVEAYLNTVNLGYGCYGIQSASQAYFSKDVEKLSLSECVALAAMPQSPSTNALVLRYEKGSVSSKDKNIIKTDNDWIYYYNGEASKTRRETILKFMNEQGYIDEERMNKALKVNLKKRIKLSNGSTESYASYFTDYVVGQVIDDLVEQEGMDESKATELVYNGGLKIYSTLDSKAQDAVEKEYSDSSNFPGTTGLNKDSNGNVLKNGSILLYAYSNFFDSEGNFTLKPSEYKWKDDGSLLLKKGKRLNFYSTESNEGTDYNIEFKKMYTSENGFFCTIDGGILSIDAKYKTMTDKGSVVISADFFKDKETKDYFTETSAGLTVKATGYTLRQTVNQPQSAMVIVDNKTGQIKAMIGGRGSSGRLLYNRAESPRQPGSSIKPLAVYSAALQQGADAESNQKFKYAFERDGNKSSYGSKWTAAAYINDQRMYVDGRQWPKNWYNGFRGYMTFRTAVEQSVNVCAVKVFSEVGAEYSVDQLKKFGITTVVEEGDVNDMNAAALALGGMTKGVSPLEMAGAYAALANLGTYNEPVGYSEVLDRNGDVILKSTSTETKVLDKSVAWIMDDILRTTVTNGIASAAAIGVQPVAGKTGTTTDNYDAWFCGFTPQYSAALWIGNDVNVELTEGSASAARLWSKIMKQVCKQFSNESFSSKPSGVVSYNGEYFVKGTEQSIKKPKNSGEYEIEVCTETGELATSRCPETEIKTVKAESEEAATKGRYYCHKHNGNTNKYPINPKYKKSDPVTKDDDEEDETDEEIIDEEDTDADE